MIRKAKPDVAISMKTRSTKFLLIQSGFNKPKLDFNFIVIILIKLNFKYGLY